MRSFFEVWQNLYFFGLVFAVLMLVIFYKNKLAALAAFFVGAFVFGAFVTDGEIEKTNNLIYLGKTFDENAILQKTTQSTFGQNIIAEIQEKEILILITAPQYPEYRYGDELKISCTAKAIENVDPSFDYRMYMAKENVLYSCNGAKIQKVGENNGSWLYARILDVRSAFEKNIIKVIPQPYGALAIGLILGGSGGLSKEIQNDFSRTGMTHIVAVSGYNVTIVAQYLILVGIFCGMWRKQAIWFALVGIVLFVIMAGLPASAVRAGVMSGILLWAMKHGRLTSAENAIIFAGSVMLFLNPLLLRWDVGFQLSFLATLGIVLCSPFWEKSFVKNHKALGISEAITLSLSAQIFVLPVIAWNFHITSLISLLANVFILPIIPFSMLLVFLVSISGFVFFPLSLVLGWIVFLPLFYEIQLIHLLARFPWASVAIEEVRIWWIVIYYLTLIYLVGWMRNWGRYGRIGEEDRNVSS